MVEHSTQIGIEFISVFGLPPVDYVKLAAKLGCSHISIALAPSGENPHRYPLWSLRDDSQLRHDFRSALAHHGIKLSVGEGFLIWPDTSEDAFKADLDLMAELGVPIANVVSLDPDVERTQATLDQFAGQAQIRGMSSTLEFMPGLPISNLKAAHDLIQAINNPYLRLLIDSMHLYRSGLNPAEIAADIAALSPDAIGHIQICDVPLPSNNTLSYADEARYERLAPGAGNLPLRDLLHALPRNRVIGLEVPELHKAQANIGPEQRLEASVAALRSLLALA